MSKRDLNYLAGIILVCVFCCMLATGLLQLRLELHRFIYHRYGAYLLIGLSVVHVLANWKTISASLKRTWGLRHGRAGALRKHDSRTIISIILVLCLVCTFSAGLLQVRLNLPRSRFVYHVYAAYLTLSLALVHMCLNLNKLNAYLKRKAPLFLLNPGAAMWKSSFKGGVVIGAGVFAIAAVSVMVRWASLKADVRRPDPVVRQAGEGLAGEEQSRKGFEMAMQYHQKTKHTYAELARRIGSLDWARQPSVFKEYPQAQLVKLSTDFDFDSISVEEAIEMGPFTGGHATGPITEVELSRLLHYTNGVTGVLRYPGLTYYLRAAPSAGALYPTVIYLVVNNVEGLGKGIYHYSVKDHGLHLLREGDLSDELASLCDNPTLIGEASVVFVMSTIFHRTKWKYRERGYRYVLLDTGHVAGNLELAARALGLASCPIGTFVDDEANRLLGIDGLKEAVVYIAAVGGKGASKSTIELKKTPLPEKAQGERLPEGLQISELLHRTGKVHSLQEVDDEEYRAGEVTHKSYAEAQKLSLRGEFSRRGLSLADAIRTRRSARDYSGEPISKPQLSRLLYYAYGLLKAGTPADEQGPRRAVCSIEGLYPVEIYVVVNNVEGVARGIYHYNVPEHSLELLKEGDYRLKISNACLGQELVGHANVAIIKTALFDRVKRYGDRGYRYVHLDAGRIGGNIYLEAISMGLGACGIGAFFDDQINEMLGIDGITEAVIYVTSVGNV